MRCERCEGSAETEVTTRHFGREHLCDDCAVAVWADGQCPSGPAARRPEKLIHDIVGRLDAARGHSRRVGPSRPVRVIHAAVSKTRHCYLCIDEGESFDGYRGRPSKLIATFRDGELVSA